MNVKKRDICIKNYAKSALARFIKSAFNFGNDTGNDMMGNTGIVLYLLDSQFGGLQDGKTKKYENRSGLVARYSRGRLCSHIALPAIWLGSFISRSF
jgi:hypothetical protein